MDITGMIGDLYPIKDPLIPMFSYSRPAWLFWQGVYDHLTKVNKLTHEDALERLKHKDARRMLDDYSQEVRDLGKTLASEYFGTDEGVVA